MKAIKPLKWLRAEGSTVPPCFEAQANGGRYRIAPWKRIDGAVRYEAFFIPTGAQSMADVRDIAGSAEQGADGLDSIEEARTAAERDYAEQLGE